MPGELVPVALAAAALLNALAFAAYALDKRRARRGGRRVAESTLLAVGLLGPLGAWSAVLLVRHKTRRPWFLSRLLLVSAVLPALAWAVLA